MDSGWTREQLDAGEYNSDHRTYGGLTIETCGSTQYLNFVTRSACSESPAVWIYVTPMESGNEVQSLWHPAALDVGLDL